MLDRVLYVFRRDLRMEDNTALAAALAQARGVAAAFIFDPRQCRPHDYFSPRAFQFLLASLDDLARDLEQQGGRLFRFYGEAEQVVDDLLARNDIQAVYFNRDHTPFSVRRDGAIAAAVRRRGRDVHVFDDALLFPPGAVMKQAGGPYTVFTPFRKKAQSLPFPAPASPATGSWITDPLLSAFAALPDDLRAPASSGALVIPPGRSAGLTILRGLDRFGDYARTRDIPALPGTTRLSAHLKFGTISVREAGRAIRTALGQDHPLVHQLLWRDFFTQIAWHFPHVFGQSFYGEYDRFPWRDAPDLLAAWQEGRTGFPLVDAGMRELKATGFMHTRARMVTASFLVKDLGMDWRRGEQYFARNLVDYDPAVNNGNWQWAASTGCDHQPYFRVFNPDRQRERFDPDSHYVRRWIPELGTPQYPRPLVDHAKASVSYRKTICSVRIN